MIPATLGALFAVLTLLIDNRGIVAPEHPDIRCWNGFGSVEKRIEGFEAGHILSLIEVPIYIINETGLMMRGRGAEKIVDAPKGLESNRPSGILFGKPAFFIMKIERDYESGSAIVSSIKAIVREQSFPVIRGDNRIAPYFATTFFLQEMSAIIADNACPSPKHKANIESWTFANVCYFELGREEDGVWSIVETHDGNEICGFNIYLEPGTLIGLHGVQLLLHNLQLLSISAKQSASHIYLRRGIDRERKSNYRQEDCGERCERAAIGIAKTKETDKRSEYVSASIPGSISIVIFGYLAFVWGAGGALEFVGRLSKLSGLVCIGGLAMIFHGVWSLIHG
jgi:hypothetical protein